VSKLDEAIRTLRQDPRYADIVRDSYLERNVHVSAERFFHSAEFSEVRRLLDNKVPGSRILDLGAGTGIASYAFIQSGAHSVYAIEPDLSDEVGCGALKRLTTDKSSIRIICALGEHIPLADESVDIVYARQVLHHTRDLPRVLNECARVLRKGGVFLTCREHVADNERQLQMFLRNHPIHQLVGGENAYRLDEYLYAISASGLQLEKVFGPWDSVLNAFPAVRNNGELALFARTLLRRKLGFAGSLISFVPGVQTLVWQYIKRPVPGRMYSFLASKP
jgi:ubiquinone/menaquinone biosynthesis C-methylase UbiE